MLVCNLLRGCPQSNAQKSAIQTFSCFQCPVHRAKEHRQGCRKSDGCPVTETSHSTVVLATISCVIPLVQLLSFPTGKGDRDGGMNNLGTLRDGKRGPLSKVDGKVFPSLPTRYRNLRQENTPPTLWGWASQWVLEITG